MINKEYLKRVIDGEEDETGASVLKAFLWIGSFFYWCGLLIRKTMYSLKICKSYQFNQKVVSVGNITVGGVGKTPLVQYLAQYLSGQSKKVVILMRGYMTRANEVSDEASLLKTNLPSVKVLAGKDRVHIAKHYLKDHPADVLILDDGFQHLRIKRDLDIVMIDCANPWGNGFLLPAGILRERLPALSRAQVVVLSKADLGKENINVIGRKIFEMNPKCLVVESIHQPTHVVDLKTEQSYDLSNLQGKIICALSAIGAPESFEDLLRKQGAVIEESYRFMDHHSFSRNDIVNIVQFCKSHQIVTIVTTQKDAVKLKSILQEFKEDIQFMYLSIQLKITKGEDKFRGRINSLFSA